MISNKKLKPLKNNLIIAKIIRKKKQKIKIKILKTLKKILMKVINQIKK